MRPSHILMDCEMFTQSLLSTDRRILAFYERQGGALSHISTEGEIVGRTPKVVKTLDNIYLYDIVDRAFSKESPPRLAPAHGVQR